MLRFAGLTVSVWCLLANVPTQALSADVHLPVQSDFCPAPPAFQLFLDRGDLLLQSGSAGLSIEPLEAALGVAQRAHNESDVARAEGALGTAFKARGDFDDARTHLEQSIDIAVHIKQPAIEAKAQNNLGNLLFAEGHFQKALTVYGAAIDAAERASDGTAESTASANAARVEITLGSVASANKRLTRLLEISDAGALALLTAGRLSQGEGQAQGDALASRFFDRARRQANAPSDGRERSLADGYAAEVAAKTASPQTAAALTNRAIFEAQQAGAIDLLYRWNWDLGRQLHGAGDVNGAVLAYRRAMEAVESVRGDIPVEFREGRSSFLQTIGLL